MKIYYVDTEGWVTEEYLLHRFINTVLEKEKEYDLFKIAIATKEEEVSS